MPFHSSQFYDLEGTWWENLVQFNRVRSAKFCRFPRNVETQHENAAWRLLF